jgi:hypothetical protein
MPGGDGDFTDDAGELPGATGVLRTLAVHDVLKLGMACHWIADVVGWIDRASYSASGLQETR